MAEVIRPFNARMREPLKARMREPLKATIRNIYADTGEPPPACSLAP